MSSNRTSTRRIDRYPQPLAQEVDLVIIWD
jgi:hypothetical protein